MRRNIQVVSLWILIFVGFAWLLTVVYSAFVPALRPVVRVLDMILVIDMLVFTVSSWWNTIRHFFRRMTRRFIF